MITRIITAQNDLPTTHKQQTERPTNNAPMASEQRAIDSANDKQCK